MPRATLADNAAMASLVPHAKVGRNDPCPCGSNKKYKRCCLSRQHSVDDSGWQRQRVASDSLTEDMLVFARKRFGDEIFEAWMDFNQSDTPPPMGDDFSEQQVFFPIFCSTGIRGSQRHRAANAPSPESSRRNTCW